MTERKTPLGIVVLGIFSLLIGLVFAGSGLTLVLIPSFLGNFGVITGVILFVIGIGAGIFGVGCFLAWSWSWLIGVILLVFSILLQLVVLTQIAIMSISLLDYGNIFGILLACVILWYLFQPHIKTYFQRS